MVKIKIHSIVDAITNSSTELFCYVKRNAEEVQKILDGILAEFGCTAVNFYVDDDCWLWDEEKEEEYQEEGVVSINWDYEINHEPCKMMMKRLEEVFGGDKIEIDY